jgi:hypothetical protein
MTAIDSLTPSGFTPPSDPAELQAWLDDEIDELSALMEVEMRRIARDACTAYLDTVTAAGDPAALDGMEQAWQAFVGKEVGPYLGKLHLEGSLTAVLGAPPLPSGLDKLWAPVVNDEAVDYAKQASNRIVGAGNDVWWKVRSKVTAAVREGVPTETLKGQIEKITGYSEFRADTIARTEVMGAYNAGDAAGAKALGEFGPVEKQWLAAIDKRTRPSHADANGQCVPFGESFKVGGATMPYPGSGPAAEVVNCRCVVLHLYAGDTRPDGSKIEAPTPITAEPERWESPRFPGGKLSADPHAPSLPGTHEKHVLTDAHGNRYLFKPQEAWVAHGEVAATHIGRLGGLDDLPDIWVHEHNGRVGTLQRFVPDARNGFPGPGSGFDPLKVSAADRELMMRHRPLDWMIGNHDAHSAQWVRSGYANQGGKLHGVDKGQAFKWFRRDRLSYDYDPNALHGQSMPVYNHIERSWARGHLRDADDARLFSAAKDRPVGKVIERLSAIPDDEYRAILRTYGEGRYRNDPAGLAKFLDDAVDRKNGLRRDFDDYFRKLNVEHRASVPKPPKKPAMGGTGGPKGMAGSSPSKADVDFMREHDHPITDAYSTEAKAVRSYTSSSHEINTAARQGGQHRLHGAIVKAMPPVKKDMTVYRGARIVDRLPDPRNPATLQGTVIRDRGFLSTSAGDRGPAFGGEVGIHIRVNEGTRGAYVQPISAYRSEREFLLDANQPLYVHTVRRPKGGWESQYQWIMEVETVDAGWVAKQGMQVWDTNSKTWGMP